MTELESFMYYKLFLLVYHVRESVASVTCCCFVFIENTLVLSVSLLKVNTEDEKVLLICYLLTSNV